MSFNEFKQHRLDIKNRYEVHESLVNYTDEECHKILISVFQKYSYLIEPMLPFLQIKEDASSREALNMIVLEIINSVDGDMFNLGYDGTISEETDCEVTYLAWIPIRPFLNFRNDKEIFDKICYIIREVSQFVDCEKEIFREMESNMLKDRDMEDDYCFGERKRCSDLYTHYIGVFKSFDKTFTYDEVLKSAENHPSLKEFFEDAIAFLKNPSVSGRFNGYYHGNFEDFMPIESSTIYNFCWDFNSNLDDSITEHINSIANEAGFMNISYHTEIDRVDEENKIQFNLMDNLFSKQYGLYR